MTFIVVEGGARCAGTIRNPNFVRGDPKQGNPRFARGDPNFARAIFEI
ncbi:MAG: hypothetical protein IH941_05855 [Acidobacteria bacterium]|nr:hypothetical protein [Acidobacteriota bacterium]